MPKENKIRVLYVQPGKYPEERIIENNLKSMQKLVDGDIYGDALTDRSSVANTAALLEKRIK